MRKILFVTLDDFSNINSSLRIQLQKHFADYTIDSLEIKPILRRNYPVLIRGVIAVFTEYFDDFLTGDKKIREWRKILYHTPFMKKYFNRIIALHLKHHDYSFVFQTQSIFDSSSKQLPNFVYIDHTNLNNLNYPHINPREYLCSEQYVKLEREIYEHATLLMVMSSNMKDSLVNQYGTDPRKIKLVYAGSNTRMNEHVDRKKYANKNILFVGKDWERKGGPLLIEAFKEVLKTIPDATLTILGCNPSIVVPNCTIKGEVPLEIVAEYYNKASVFCLPTVREPFGIVFIEAMLNRLAIVTNDMGATPEFVINGENGYRLDNKVKGYTDSLISLLSDPVKCEQFGTRSFDLASQTYTWDNVGNLIAENIKRELKEEMIHA